MIYTNLNQKLLKVLEKLIEQLKRVVHLHGMQSYTKKQKINLNKQRKKGKK